MSVVSPTWLSLSGEANYIRSTYIDGFLDVSSSRGVLLRSDVSFGGNLVLSRSNFTGTVTPNSTAAASATYSTSTNSTSSWSNNGVTWSSATSGSYEDSLTRYPYKAFDSNTADVGWLFGVGTGTQTNRYTGTNNTYAGTTTGTTLQNSVGATYGEWLQVQSSVPVIMKDYTLYVTDAIARHPKTYFIAGSSDNSTWYPIIKVAMTTNPGTAYLSSGTITIPSGTTASTTTTGLTYNYTYTTYGNGTNAYSYFRIIITQTSGTDIFGTGLAEWNINFTPSPAITSAITLAPSTTAYGQLDLTGGLSLSKNLYFTDNKSGVSIGFSALNALTSGDNNNAIGYQALLATTTGNSNIAIGGQAGDTNTTGSNNTYIGRNADANAATYSNSTALGSGATITASNQIMLGTASETVTIPNQIAFSYSSNPTIGTTSLGYFITGTGSTTPITTTGIVVSTISNLPVGVFIISFIVGLNSGSTSGQYAQFHIGTNVGAGDILGLTFLQYNGSYSSSSGSVVYKNTTTRTIYLNGGSSSSNIGIYNRFFQAVRIA